MESQAPSAKMRNGKIDLLRFLFSVLMVYYHFSTLFNGAFPTVSEFAVMAEHNRPVGSNIVISFFVISGYFFYSSRSWITPPIVYIKDRVSRLWPMLAFSLLINFHSYIDFLNLFFINSGLGVIKEASSNPASWFVCVLFWYSMFFHFLFRANNGNVLSLISKCLLVALFSLAFYIHRETGLYSEIVFSGLPFLTVGVLLFFIGFPIGILIAFFVEEENEQKKRSNSDKKSNCVFQVLLRETAWIISLIYYIYIIAFSDNSYSSFFYLLVFIVLLFFSLNSSTGKIINCSFIHTLGAASFSIYLLQFPLFYYIKKIVFVNQDLLLSGYCFAFLVVLLCVVLSIIAHFIVEKPMTKLLKRLFQTI